MRLRQKNIHHKISETIVYGFLVSIISMVTGFIFDFILISSLIFLITHEFPERYLWFPYDILIRKLWFVYYLFFGFLVWYLIIYFSESQEIDFKNRRLKINNPLPYQTMSDRYQHLWETMDLVYTLSCHNDIVDDNIRDNMFEILNYLERKYTDRQYKEAQS